MSRVFFYTDQIDLLTSLLAKSRCGRFYANLKLSCFPSQNWGLAVCIFWEIRLIPKWDILFLGTSFVLRHKSGYRIRTSALHSSLSNILITNIVVQYYPFVALAISSLGVVGLLKNFGICRVSSSSRPLFL